MDVICGREVAASRAWRKEGMGFDGSTESSEEGEVVAVEE